MKRYRNVSLSQHFTSQPQTFYSICRDHELPYPEHINRREKQHLVNCFSCRELWAYFAFDRLIMKHQTLEHAEQAWCNLLESERMDLLETYLKERKVIFDSWLKKISGYYTFLQSNQSKELWKELSDEERQVYYDLAQKRQEERNRFLKQLPKYVAIDFKSYKKRLRASKPKRPTSGSIQYAHVRWNSLTTEQKSLKKYHDWMKVFMDEWKNMKTEDRQPYMDRYHHELELFHRKRKELERDNQANKRRRMTPVVENDEVCQSDTE